MRKFEEFFLDVAQLRSNLRPIRRVVKEVLGDSTRNHRTLTVSQVVRYLETNQVRRGRKLAKQLKVAARLMEGHILERRRSRTDAIDITEFVNTYRTVVMNRKDAFMRRRVGFYLSKVG